MQAWLADKLEHWPIERLLPYIRNARTNSEAQIAQIAASIAEFGFTAPILAGSDGVIVAVKRWEEFTGKKAVLEGAADGRA